jgi:hypothetical protein
MFTRKKRFTMERLETRQLMAADTGAAFNFNTTVGTPVIDHLPVAEAVSVARMRPTTRLDFSTPGAPDDGIGDIKATLLGGNLYLSEADGQAGLANGLSITRLANGHILLTGQDPTNTGGPESLINGQHSMEFAVTGSLFTNLGDGENQVVFGEGTGGLPTFQDVAVSGGSGQDRIIINGLVTRGSASFNTGGGDDWVFVSNSLIGDGFGYDQLSVYTGAGADTVTIKNGTHVNGWIDIQTYNSLSESDADVVYFDTEAWALRDVNVRTGGGEDLILGTIDSTPTVFFSALEVNGSLIVDTGAGADRVYLRGVKTGGDFHVYTGDGADDVTIDFNSIEKLDGTYFIPSVGGNVDIQTFDALSEADADNVRILNEHVAGSVLARLGDGNDYFQITYGDYIGHDLNVDMGAGDDVADVAVYVWDHLMVHMGDGNDTLNLGKTWAYRLIADGGMGFDSLKTTADTKAQNRDNLSWERINGRLMWIDDIIFGDANGGVLTRSP